MSVGNEVKLEFAVQMTCKSCEQSVQKVLEANPDIKSFSIDLMNERVMVETALDAEKVRDLLESSGRKAIVRGVGTQASKMEGLDYGAGVSILHKNGSAPIVGVTRLFQPSDDTCVIEGTVDGLAPNQPHAVRVHELGDLSGGCDSCGSIFGAVANQVAAGEIGTVTADANGRASFRISSADLKLWEVIGRSVVISELGRGHWDRRVACGVIARSAGLFANEKKVCACDGIPLWDESVEPLRFPSANL